MIYYHFPVVLNDLSYNIICLLLLLLLLFQNTCQITKLNYILVMGHPCLWMLCCAAYLSIMCYITSNVRMHMLLLFCGCSKIVLYFWNQGFVYIFCENIGLIKMLISSIVKTQSTVPSQLQRGLFKRLVLIICLVVNPQFLDCRCIPMSINDNNWTWSGCVESNVPMYDGGW
jgi:hypothetical protein